VIKNPSRRNLVKTYTATANSIFGPSIVPMLLEFLLKARRTIGSSLANGVFHLIDFQFDNKRIFAAS
jgi:hypothetical protein